MPSSHANYRVRVSSVVCWLQQCQAQPDDELGHSLCFIATAENDRHPCFTGLPWTSGLSGAVYFISDRAVIKRPFPSYTTSQEQLNFERRIYERLGKQPRITAFLGSPQVDTILLDRMQHTLRHRLLELRNLQQQPAIQDAKRWALQTAEGLYYIYSRGAKQMDIGTYNVLLDGEENADCQTFAGSSLDGSRPTVTPSVHATHPRLSIVEPTVTMGYRDVGEVVTDIEAIQICSNRDGRVEVRSIPSQAFM